MASLRLRHGGGRTDYIRFPDPSGSTRNWRSALFQVPLLLAALAPGQEAAADLVLVDADIRTVESTEWYAGLEVVFRDVEYFIALSEDPALIDAGCNTILEGPFDLDDLALVHLSPGHGARPGLPGEVIFERGDVAIIRIDGGTPAPAGMPGVRLVAPLRVITPGAQAAIPAVVDYDAMIDDMVAAVSEDSIMAVIRHLEDYGTRLCISPEYDQAAEWVDTWFGLHWISSYQQQFYYHGDQMSNVIAEIPGQISPDSIYIICAHLDSITWPLEDTAPGADDNASGSAAVLEAARVMARYNFRYTVRFICFGAEEVGLVGSDYYAQTAFQAGDRILGVLNLDMILFAPAGYDTLWIPYDSQSEALAGAIEQAMAMYVPALDVVTEYDPSATYSDHSSFWSRGYPAVLGIEYAVDDNPYYHSEADTLSSYSGFWPFGTDCVRASVAALATLARPTGPSGIGDGGAASQSLLHVSPNPASSTIEITLDGMPGEAAECTIFGMDGRVVAGCPLTCGTPLELDVTLLPRGVYAVRWESASASGAARLVLID